MVKLNNFHLKNIEKICKKLGCEMDKIDVKALWDSSLSARENYEIIKEELKKLGFVCEEEMFNRAEMEDFERKMAEMEFENKINKIKELKISELSEFYKDYYEHISSFLENKKVNGFVCVGKGGTGKSFNLMLCLKEKGIDFKLIKGHFTPLSFYRFLYENRESSHIIIDDICRLSNDKDLISLLLGALDYDNRLVEWQTSKTPLTIDLPKEFEFNSKIFILANEFYSNNEFLNALKDRCIYYELKFTKEQIIQMLYILANKRNYPSEIVDYIKELSDKCVINNLSLRLLDKVYPYYNKPNWKELIKQVLEIDEIKSIVYELMKSGKSVREQIEEFKERTGYSRATYFRIKSSLRDGNV
ncbi:MAG: hypothetical protein OH338_05025 [Candidatus Parvarchaeota archaeon]|nr:hypothetical protein [Candidatus Parvarchaeum tengchongense]